MANKKNKTVDVSAAKVWSYVRNVDTTRLDNAIKEAERIVCEDLYPYFQSPRSLKVYQRYANHMNANRYWSKEINSAKQLCNMAKTYQ